MSTVLLNGCFVGLVYGLFGVGLVVVYRGSRVINFAHGETGMVGAFIFAELWADNGVALVLAVPVAIGVSALLGAATEHFVVRPLRTESRLSVMIGTFAVGSLLLAFAGRRWGLNPRFIEPLIGGRGVTVAGLYVQPSQLLIVALTAVLLAGLWAMYRFTSFGLRLRATAIDPYAAGQVGINVSRTSLATWMLAGTIAGLSAILIAPLVAFHVFFMTGLLVRGIAAALVGGLTSLWGTFVAGVLLGVAEAVIAFKAPVAGMVEVTLAAFIIVMLLVRPGGLVRSAY